MTAPAADMDPLPAGGRIGSYDLVSRIAEGGMGAVYEVEHRVTKQRRALKIVRPELARNADFRARFVREVTIASDVKHPNLVDTQDPIEDGEILALPMELLRGETLGARLKRGAMSVAEMLSIVEPCCRAVHAVNARAVIHRDLKPLNIFLVAQGERVIPKVLDFGAARSLTDDEHTHTGVVIGSPFYMAPEQAEGRTDLDIRVDVYAMGVIAYFCLTGRRIYDTTSGQMAVAKLLRAEQYPRPMDIVPSLPPAIDAAVMKALAYDREARWPTLAEYADALVAASRGTGAVIAGPTFAHPPQSDPHVADMASGVRAQNPVTPPSEATPAPSLVSAPEGSRAPWILGGAFGIVALVLLVLLGWWAAGLAAPPTMEARPAGPAVLPPATVSPQPEIVAPSVPLAVVPPPADPIVEAPIADDIPADDVPAAEATPEAAELPAETTADAPRDHEPATRPVRRSRRWIE